MFLLTVKIEKKNTHFYADDIKITFMHQKNKINANPSFL